MSAEKDLVAKCPECGAAFRLTPQHLEAAKGWVQCGMCGHVFHSGIKPAAAPVAEKPTPAPAPEAPVDAVAAKPLAPASDAGTPETAKEPVTEIPAEAGAEAAAAGLSGLAHRMAEQEVPSSFGPKLESIILVDPNAPPADDDYGPMPEFGDKPDEKKETAAAPSFTPAEPPKGGWGSRREKTATSTGWIPRRPAEPVHVEVKKKRNLGWLWGILVLLLLAALAFQLIYYMRDKLASNHPELRPILAQMCESLDCILSLPKDTSKVIILGSDLQTENDNNMALEITLANRAAHAMAWPVLELTLTDVEDQPIARRMFAPSEYLPVGNMEAAGIQPRTEIPFNLQLQNKGLKAAGYRLRMFY